MLSMWLFSDNYVEHLKQMATGECVCRGDPHCFAFDANRSNSDHDFRTSALCEFVLSTDYCGGVLPTYAVTGVFEPVKDIGSAKSFVSEVKTYLFSLVKGPTIFRIKQGMIVTHKDQEIPQNFPQSIDGLIIDIVPAVFAHPKDFSKGVTEVMSITLPNGVNVQYDGIKGVKINVDALNSDTPRCGLCGNNDGVYDDRDFLMGQNVNGAYCSHLLAVGEELTLTSNKDYFLNSWYFPSAEKNCAGCV
ncbi:hypothetical protein CAPTEDRAFT_226917 [Capitella teleta]|uniref:VWFD domain-containing protein n=1 Tax=Capitella teleta TaxID=283909 RepID=R7U1U8_CAPTE|nr:hypothetical protein CAPTEDRAFT_226917 [Capitella teleta]|eukprot:ELT99812.1 hypothetical protein CAPTEDRAFT_226917 [Capitella teleta]